MLTRNGVSVDWPNKTTLVAEPNILLILKLLKAAGDQSLSQAMPLQPKPTPIFSPAMTQAKAKNSGPTSQPKPAKPAKPAKPVADPISQPSKVAKTPPTEDDLKKAIKMLQAGTKHDQEALKIIKPYLSSNNPPAAAVRGAVSIYLRSKDKNNIKQCILIINKHSNIYTQQEKCQSLYTVYKKLGEYKKAIECLDKVINSSQNTYSVLCHIETKMSLQIKLAKFQDALSSGNDFIKYLSNNSTEISNDKKKLTEPKKQKILRLIKQCKDKLKPIQANCSDKPSNGVKKNQKNEIITPKQSNAINEYPEEPIVPEEDNFRELSNPFSPHAGGAVVGDPNMVFGRDQLIDDIAAIVTGQKIGPKLSKTLALYGQKRTGKSTVLFHLKAKLREKSKSTIIVDLGDLKKIPLEGFERQLYRTIFSELGREIKNNHPILFTAFLNAGVEIPSRDQVLDGASARQIFANFYSKFIDLTILNSNFTNYTILLLIDEFTYIYNNIGLNKIDKEFMKYWEYLINFYKLIAVVVGQENLPNFIKAYPNAFDSFIEPRQVTYLSDTAALKMITSPPTDGLNYAKFAGPSGQRALEEITRLTRGHAYFLMIVMDRLIRQLNEAKHSYVTEADIKKLLISNLLNGDNRIKEEHFEPMFHNDGDVSDHYPLRYKLVILKCIAYMNQNKQCCSIKDIIIPAQFNDSDVLKPNQIKQIVNLLVKRNVLSIKNNSYQIYVGLFHEWLTQKCTIEFINNINDVNK
jgi:tetratricopeptide (TPR) repeat protein